VQRFSGPTPPCWPGFCFSRSPSGITNSPQEASRSCFAIKKHLREGRREVLCHQEAPPRRTQGGASPSRSTSRKDAGRRFAIKKHLREGRREALCHQEAPSGSPPTTKERWLEQIRRCRNSPKRTREDAARGDEERRGPRTTRKITKKRRRGRREGAARGDGEEKKRGHEQHEKSQKREKRGAWKVRTSSFVPGEMKRKNEVPSGPQ
jgi:hypothetical protein